MQNVYMGLDVEDFIFSEGTTYEEDYNVSDEEMNEFGVIECAEDPDVACYRIALENEQNHHAIMTAMMTKELNHVLENGTEMVYEASALANFFEMVKKQVQKFWAKVKGVFKKVIDNITSIVASNKAFVKKYRAIANTIKTPKEGKSFTGYKFNKDKMVIRYSDAADCVKTIKDAGGDVSGAVEIALNQVRGVMCGKGKSPVTADDFANTLRKGIYGDNTQTIELSYFGSFSDILNRLENASDERKAAKDSYKQAEQAVKKFLSEVKDARAKAESGSDAEKRAKAKADAISKSLTIMSTALSVQTRAIIASAVQDRKAANYWVNSQNKKGATQESASTEVELGVEII